MTVSFSGKKHSSYEQIFSVFTETSWEKTRDKYPQTTDNFFSGNKNQFFVLPHLNSTEFLIGVGDQFANHEIQAVANKFSYFFRNNILSAPTLLSAPVFDKYQTEEFVKGLFLGTYMYPFRKNHPVWKKGFSLVEENADPSTVRQIKTSVSALCRGQFDAMDWLNKPANLKKNGQLSEHLKQISKKYGFSYKSYNREKCEKLGLGAFAAVNQGSATDAAFTIMEYHCKDPKAKTIGLIGKCVLFDTGGISLKNPANMHYMKSDMGGAAAVFGTMIAAAEMQLPVNITAILPVTDNAISEKAYLPSDVVTAYNGKTIEVLDTDAEGRMTLADALAYLTKNYKTEALIDIATLTGSAVRMFGDSCGALFSNNNSLLEMLLQSGQKTAQRLWNLPLWDEWNDEIQSDVADFRNISMKPVGDCIVAAKFLEHFTGGHPAWAHLDVAAMAFGKVNYSSEKAATGYGVQLFLDVLQNFAEKN